MIVYAFLLICSLVVYFRTLSVIQTLKRRIVVYINEGMKRS